MTKKSRTPALSVFPPLELSRKKYNGKNNETRKRHVIREGDGIEAHSLRQ